MPEFHKEWSHVCKEDFHYTERLRVPGGWIYRVTTWADESYQAPTHINLVFVPLSGE